jgi:hypothetical protein
MRIIFFISILISSSAYGIEKEDLDVNLNPIYLSARPHKNGNLQSEIIFQVPLPLTKNADNTGLGPIGSIIYYDNKSLIHIETESAAVRGVGRLYYVVSAYSTTHTFVPYATLYRDFVIGYTNFNKSHESKSKAWLPPGFLYAYRKNDKVVLHLDAELYSYRNPGNNIFRLGASYALNHQWKVSASFERLGWDMKDEVNGNNVFMHGHSNNIYLKLISSKPLRDNFSFILGYAADRNEAGPGLQQKSSSRNNGIFLGVEGSLGTLVW